MVVRREHPSVYGALITLFLIDLGFQQYGQAPEGLPAVWLWLMPAATVAILAIKLLKRKTTLLATDRD